MFFILFTNIFLDQVFLHHQVDITIILFNVLYIVQEKLRLEFTGIVSVDDSKFKFSEHKKPGWIQEQERQRPGCSLQAGARLAGGREET